MCMDLSIRWTDSAAYQRLLFYLLILNLFKNSKAQLRQTVQVEIPALSLTSHAICIANLSMLTVRSTYKDTKQFFSGSYSLYAYLLSLLYPDYNINNTRKYLQSFYPLLYKLSNFCALYPLTLMTTISNSLLFLFYRWRN